MCLTQWRLAPAILGCAGAIALTSCGDGSSPGPTVALQSDAATVPLGQRATLRWSTQHATACTAAGAWSGNKAASGTESVQVPLTQTRNAFGLICSGGGRTARAEVVVTVPPPRFSLQVLPLDEAVDLNDAGDVLGYENFYRLDPALWTDAGVLHIDTCGSSCPPGYAVTVFAVNNHRTVLARLHFGPGVNRVALVPLGGQSVPAGGAPIDQPTALNDSLQFVGRGYSGLLLGLPPPFNKAVLVSAGQVTVVQPSDGVDGAAMAINAAGVVAGNYTTATGGPVHAFRYENGVAADLGTLLDGLPVPHGINAAGTIVGEITVPSGDTRAFRAGGGAAALQALDGLGGGQSMASGVNDLEQIVGSSTVAGAPETWHATLVSAGTLYDLNDLLVPHAGITLEWGIDINGAGHVLATGCDTASGDCHPYLLTPITAR
jgi:probable HAF family extracellular repeat protein